MFVFLYVLIAIVVEINWAAWNAELFFTGFVVAILSEVVGWLLAMSGYYYAVTPK